MFSLHNVEQQQIISANAVQFFRLEGDRSEILDESIPLTNDKAFIRTVAHRVSFLEEKVPEAKKSWCLFNTTFQLFRYAVIPSLKTSGTYLNSVKNIMNMQSG